MRKHRKWILFNLILVLAMVMPLAAMAAPETQSLESGSMRVIVELADAPLAAYDGGLPGLRATTSADGKLDVTSPEAQAYLDYLDGQQVAFTTALERSVPGASVATYLTEENASESLNYRVTFNGMTINVPSWDKDMALALLAIPGVKAVYPEREYRVNLDVSHDYMGSAAMWAAAGGQADAGAGIKVAVLDTGIDEEHPFFDPAGFAYPDGYPKGDARYTTEKVIVARGYYRPDDPPANPGPTDYGSHGTGTAGIVAGNMGTVAEISNAFGAVTKTVSGVAPAAQLMNYQIFYTAVSGSESAWTPEILAAIDDMVDDGADVSSNSWGGVDNMVPTVDPTGVAFQNAVNAGVVVAKSAGNDGPSYNTLGDAMPESLIIVGGNDFGRRVGASASVMGPGTVPVMLTNMLAIESGFQPDLAGVMTGVYVYVGRTDPANFEGCDPLDATTAAAVDGNIALISRGSCNFDLKVQNAQDAGAVAAIIFNHQTGGLPIVMGGDPRAIPAVMVGNENGLDMITWEAANPGTATVKLDPALSYIPDAGAPDTMYQSSSRGPDLMQRMGVDVIAPGESVWTSYSITGGWNTVSGTSFSAPFASGAAAVMKGIYPTWRPWAIRSAMMATAKNQGIYNDYAHTIPAGVLDMGAGRLQFDEMVDPGLVFDNPSLSFQQMMTGTQKTIKVTATDVFSRAAGTDFVYTLAVSETGNMTTTANFDLSVSPATLTFGDDGDTGSFDVTMDIPADATPGDYEGWVWLRHGPHELHLPVWVRVRPEAMENHVLLLDDDASAYGFPDYVDYYTTTLEALGYTYDVWPVDLWNYYTGRGFPTIAEMQGYDKIVWFTGDSYYSYYELGAELQSRLDLFDTLRSGGAKVVATGMDLSGYEYAGNTSDQYVLQLGMAAGFLQEDAYAPADTLAPNPAVEGYGAVPAIHGMTFDLGTGSGASNQFYVDELEPYSDPELYGGRGFLRSLEPGSEGNGWVGIVRSMEPTFDNDGVLPGPDYRTVYLSFGLEGINDDTGFNTREELMGELFNWLQDEVEVSLAPASGKVNELIELNATLTSSVGAEGIQYRWVFGDGSDIAVTSSPSAFHVYEAAGTYLARVEVTDAYGHTAMSEAMVTVQPPVYLTKTATPKSQAAGGLITYTLSFANYGTSITGVVLSDTLPADVKFSSADPAAVYDDVAHEVVWTGLNLDTAVEMSATIVVTVGPSVDLCTPLINTVYLLDGDIVLETYTLNHNYCYLYLPLVFKGSAP